ncbi:MAG TPA: ABC-2 family transporter protein [Gemmataceae bacterium]|jgi:ABC-2 type transport system permease protein|nr:ABC-2 family transporter protein [Gemmataceae bacterium]
MISLFRYLRLFAAFGRFSLLSEMAFRANYLLKVTVEVLWIVLLLLFYKTIFARTSVVADWTEDEYLFFLGCYYALEGLMETLFLGNFSEFSELVRKGDLDLILLQPVDEQFVVSCRTIDWATLPNVLMGAGLMIYGLTRMGWPVTALQVIVFAVTFPCALAMAYSFILMLASTAVWMVRNQSLYELWWLFTSLMRYPREIFRGRLGDPVGWLFTFLIPVLLVSNVPARSMARALDPHLIGYMLFSTVVLVALSRWVFRRALRSYRSASS